MTQELERRPIDDNLKFTLIKLNAITSRITEQFTETEQALKSSGFIHTDLEASTDDKSKLGRELLSPDNKARYLRANKAAEYKIKLLNSDSTEEDDNGLVLPSGVEHIVAKSHYVTVHGIETSRLFSVKAGLIGGIVALMFILLFLGAIYAKHAKLF